MLIAGRTNALQALKNDKSAEQIAGYFALYGTLSEPIWDWYKWELAGGCFDENLAAMNDQCILFAHNWERVFASRDSGTAIIRSDETGLYGECTPVDAQWATDVMKSISRGDIKAASIGWIPLSTSWKQEDGFDVEVMRKCDLLEMSVVKRPAFRDTIGRINVVPKAMENAASLNRAICRASHKLDMTDEDKSLLTHYRSQLDQYLKPEQQEAVKRVAAAPPVVIPMDIYQKSIRILELGS